MRRENNKVNGLLKLFGSFFFFAGIYCAPLRLLAWEVAKQLNKENVPCDLFRGKQRDEVDGAKHRAISIEMADVTSEYDCAVIEEGSRHALVSTILCFCYFVPFCADVFSLTQQVIEWLDKAVLTMKKGEVALLSIAPEYA